MRKLNKILLLFLLVLLGLLVGIWEFLQSDLFGNNISKTLNKLTTSQLGVSVDFENLDFQLFPPGANLNQVIVKINREDYKGDAKIGKLGVYFNLLDSFQTKLTVKELFLSDAVIYVDSFKAGADKEKKSVEDLNIAKTMRTLRESFPVVLEKALLRDTEVRYGNNSHFINMFSLTAKEASATIDGDLREINLKTFSKIDEKLDQVEFSIEVFDEKVRVESLKLNQGITTLYVEGEVKKFLKKPELNLSGSILGEIGDVGKYIDISNVGKLEKGVLQAQYSMIGTLEEYKLEADINLQNFVTDFADGDQILGKLTITPKSLSVDRVVLTAGEQRLEQLSPFTLYDFEKNKFGREPLRATAKNIRLNNALKILSPILDPLKGSLNGRVTMQINNDNVTLSSSEAITVKDLRLIIGKNKILGAKEARLLQPEFVIPKNAFRMKTLVETGSSSFFVEGSVLDGELNFRAINGKINLEDIGPYAGLNIKGNGPFNLTAKGKGADTKLEIKSFLNDFEFEKYKLDSVTSSVFFDFATNEIKVRDAQGELGKALVNGQAVLNYSNLDIKSSGILNAKRYSDVKAIFNPLLGKVDAIPQDMYGNWDFNFNISGKMKPELLNVEGKFNGKNNYVFNEGVESLDFNLYFKDNVFSIKNAFAKKAGGSILAGYTFNVADSNSSYNVVVDSIPLSDIANYAKSPFAFDADLSGKVVGDNIKGTNTALLDLKLTNTNLAGKSYPDSGVSLALGTKEAAFDVNFLGNTGTLTGRVYLKDKKKRSNIDLNIDSRDIATPLGLLKFVEMSALNLKGGMNVEAKATFPGMDYEKGDLSVHLKRIFLEKGEIELDEYNRAQPQIIVEKGKIKKWDIELKGRRVYLVSTGEGELWDKHTIDNRFKIDASILEIFNNIISQAGGTLRARARANSGFLSEKYEATLIGDSVSISSDKLPSSITDANFKVAYKDKKIEMENFKASLSSGSLFVDGWMSFNGLIPEVDARLRFNGAGFPIMKKSNLVVGGNLHLSGNKLPYSLTGEAQVQKLLLMNEVTEFQKTRDTAFKREFDYLPEQGSSKVDNFLNMNIDIETVEPIIVSNSLADIGIVGNAQVIGGEEDFKLVGKFNLAPRQNKVFFKSNEYVLTKANIFFYERNKVSNPELDIAATSTINDYRIFIKVYGPVENFNMELSSEPALTQEDVLSLIAFGYTEDLSANLSEQEKESLTRAGVGSIIFDSFKINETLKNEFGLQVNLGTQIQEESRSYLQRVNSDSSVGRVNSATTIEVKKQLNEAMNLSVSSTVGGSVGQRQSMYLNYNINNKLSVEGVYETRTSDEGEETINDSSLGADVKIRWSFR